MVLFCFHENKHLNEFTIKKLTPIFSFRVNLEFELFKDFYLIIAPQLTRPPAFPVGWVTKSSGDS